MTSDHFAKIIPTENIYIVINESYTDLIKEQLPELAEEQTLSEPACRSITPCIAYVAYHTKARSPEANIIVAPSGHLILKENVFPRDVQKALDFAKRNRALITLGTKPSRPETGYGYIQSSDAVVDDFTKVKTFVKKPSLELAKVFVGSEEFFWNSGLFAWDVNTILEALSKYLLDVNSHFNLGKDKFNAPEEKAFIQENFPYCLDISVDYDIMEKAHNIYMLCIDSDWADLDGWGFLFDLANKDEGENAVLENNEAMLYECSDNVIALNNSGCLAIIQGLEDYVMAESGNVLLIYKKDDEQHIKQFIANAKVKYGKGYN